MTLLALVTIEMQPPANGKRLTEAWQEVPACSKVLEGLGVPRVSTGLGELGKSKPKPQRMAGGGRKSKDGPRRR